MQTTYIISIQEIILDYIEDLLFKLQEKILQVKQDNEIFQVRYFEGQIVELENLKIYFLTNNTLDKIQLTKHLNNLWNTIYEEQKTIVGKINNTHKPNKEGCFCLGKLKIIQEIRNTIKVLD